MATAAHLLYALAIAIFFGLTVGFGAVAFFDDPVPPPIPGARPTPDERPTPEEERARQEEIQRVAQESREELEDHRRNQLIGVTLIAAIALIGGIAAAGLPAALRLGGILGGLGIVIWAVIRNDDFVGDGALFAVVFLVFLVLAALSHPTLRRRMRQIMRLGSDDSLLYGGPDDQD